MSGPSRSKSFTEDFLAEATEIIARLDVANIEKAAGLLASTRSAGGRLFILGVGGSAANASHAVNDFRKIAGIEAYAPTDNVSELTARANDEGWSSIFDGWLRVSRLRQDDLLLILSVGGGNIEQNISPNLVAALNYAKSIGTKIIGVVGRDGGYTAKVADACVIIPTVNPAHTTPHTEAFQAVVWHLLVSHPAVKLQSTKWESMASPEQTPRGVSRPRRRDQQSFCSRRQAVSSAESAGTGSSSWRSGGVAGTEIAWLRVACGHQSARCRPRKTIPPDAGGDAPGFARTTSTRRYSRLLPHGSGQM